MYSPWGCKESDTTQQLSLTHSLISRRGLSSAASCFPDAGSYGKTVKQASVQREGHFSLLEPPVCAFNQCVPLELPKSLSYSVIPSPVWQQLRAAQSRGMTSLQFAETANIPGEHGTLSKHSHTPGLISLFLPTLLLPAGSNPCSQKAKNPAASISAAASQSLFIINFIKGLGSPSPFHVPDSGEIMTVITAKALSTGISMCSACKCACVFMCLCV